MVRWSASAYTGITSLLDWLHESVSPFDIGKQTLKSKQISICDLIFQWLIKVISTLEGSLVSSFKVGYTLKI